MTLKKFWPRRPELTKKRNLVFGVGRGSWHLENCRRVLPEDMLLTPYWEAPFPCFAQIFTLSSWHENFGSILSFLFANSGFCFTLLCFILCRWLKRLLLSFLLCHWDFTLLPVLQLLTAAHLYKVTLKSVFAFTSCSVTPRAGLHTRVESEHAKLAKAILGGYVATIANFVPLLLVGVKIKRR